MARRTLAVAFLWLACTPAESPPAPTQTHSDPPPVVQETTAPQPGTGSGEGMIAPVAQARPKEITITRVEIANPVVVEGRARTFENHVVLRARDARGALISETFTTAVGDMGHHNPYRGSIWLTRDPGAKITVEALEYSARDGSERSLVSVTRPFNLELVDVRLYLPNPDCTRVEPRPLRLPKSVAMARLLVETLIAQRAPFPKDSRVESIVLRNGTITADFNAGLRNVGGACAAQMIRESVTRTLMTLPSVKKVVITAGGSEALALQP